MIAITLTPNVSRDRRGQVDEASCVVGDQKFVSTSRTGSLAALCRQLVAAGVPDQPWQAWNVRHPIAEPSLSGPSILEMARYVYKDTADGIVRKRISLDGGKSRA